MSMSVMTPNAEVSIKRNNSNIAKFHTFMHYNSQTNYKS